MNAAIFLSPSFLISHSASTISLLNIPCRLRRWIVCDRRSACVGKRGHEFKGFTSGMLTGPGKWNFVGHDPKDFQVICFSAIGGWQCKVGSLIWLQHYPTATVGMCSALSLRKGNPVGLVNGPQLQVVFCEPCAVVAQERHLWGEGRKVSSGPEVGIRPVVKPWKSLLPGRAHPWLRGAQCGSARRNHQSFDT